MQAKSRRLVNGKDWLITGSVEVALVLGTSLLSSWLYGQWPMSLFAAVALWYGIFVGLTLLVLKLQRAYWPIEAGEYTAHENPGMLHRWKFHQFLTLNNLFCHYQHSLLPPPVRKFFSRMLGAKIGRGIVSIGGVIIDPYLITIEESATIGHDSILLPCRFVDHKLTLGRISVARNAVVGARSLVEHSVSIGEGAMVKAMSLVKAGTVIAPYEIWGGVPAVKMSEQPRNIEAAPRFMGWRDLVLTPLVQTSLLLFSAGLTWWLNSLWHGGLFEWVFTFYVSLTSLTLLTLKIIRTVSPFPLGQFSFETDPNICYQWNLYSYLCITHLFLHYQNGLVPIPLRKFFCWLLGTDFQKAKGLIAVAGILTDHYAVSIADGAVIGEDSLILPHAVTVDSLILKPIRVERGAIIGQRSVIMPGVVIGENSYVRPMSLVTMGTQIPPNEVWGGVPARKLGDLVVKHQLMKGSRGDVPATVLPLMAIFVVTGLCFGQVLAHFQLDLFGSLITFYVLLCAVAAIGLKIFRAVAPLPDGTYGVDRDPAEIEKWKATAFIAFTCLTIPYQFGLIPPALRKPMLWLMGAKISRKGPATTTGFVADPNRFEMGPNVVLMINSIIMPDTIRPGELQLGKVCLADSVSIGPGAIVLSGSTIGARAVVEPMSLVNEDTHIPAGETWGGIPARRR